MVGWTRRGSGSSRKTEGWLSASEKQALCSAIGYGRFNPLGLLADKVVSNQWNIISFITRRRHGEGKHIESVIEIAAEVLLAESLVTRLPPLK